MSDIVIMEHLITQFVENLPLDYLLGLADKLEVYHCVGMWLDDAYPDNESRLRESVIDAMLELGL